MSLKLRLGKKIQSRRYQAGFLLPLAVFILTALAVLALTLGRSSSAISALSAQALFSQQAWHAADSGANFALSFLLLRANPNRSDGKADCALLQGKVINFSQAALKNCSVVLQCSAVDSASDDASYFELRSQGSCGAAPLDAQRTLAVSTYLAGEP